MSKRKMKNSGITTKTGSLYNNIVNMPGLFTKRGITQGSAKVHKTGVFSKCHSMNGAVQQKASSFVNSQNTRNAPVLNLGNVGHPMPMLAGGYTQARAGVEKGTKKTCAKNTRFSSVEKEVFLDSKNTSLCLQVKTNVF